MLTELIKKHPIIKEMFLYGLIGGTTALIDTLCYSLLTRVFHLDELLSNFIGVNIGIALSFLLNTFFNFKKTTKLKKRAISFFAVGYCGLLLSMLIMYVGVDLLKIHDLIVKLGSVFLVAVFQFILNKLITYGKIDAQKTSEKTSEEKEEKSNG